MSIINDILDEVAKRVRNIRTTNGYTLNIGPVQRPNRSGDYLKTHLSVVVHHKDPEENAELSCPGNPNAIAYDLPIIVVGHIRQEYSDDEPLDALHSDLWENLARSITSVTNWHTFGGRCIDAKLEPMETLTPGDASTSGVACNILAPYRVRETTPGILA